MILTLIRRELLDNLMTFRFAAAVFITLLLVVANTAVLIKDYERRLAEYNTAVKTHRQELQEATTYSGLDIVVDRAPNPLSLFNVGLDKRLGNEVGIELNSVPTLWNAGTHGAANPFLNLFSSIDIVFIFEVVLSLMALIFAYDALAGEHERGTLRLVLSHPVRRGQLLLAKYISAMLCLLVPLLLSLLLSLMLLTGSGAMQFTGDDFLCIGGIVFTSVAYLSLFYLIGLLISSTTRRTSTALMLSMFVWGFWVLVYPNLMLTAIAPPQTSQARATSAFNQIKQIWEEFDRERKHLLATDAFPGEDVYFNMKGLSLSGSVFWGDASTLAYAYWNSFELSKIHQEDLPKLPYVQNYYGALGPLVINTAGRAWLVRKQALEDIFVRPAKFDRTLLRLSPVGMYDAATQAWAGTDLESIRDFFTAAQHYRHAVVDALYDKKAFASQHWFARTKRADRYESVVERITLPQFTFQRGDIATHAKRAAPDVGLLLITNSVLFMGILLIFVKSEV